MHQMDFVLLLHSHLPYVLNHGRWPHGSDWLCEAAIETYLPLLEKLVALDAANIAAPVTLGFTPVLANMLDHPTFARELEAYFSQRFAAFRAAPAALHVAGDEQLLPLVDFWEQRLTRLYRFWHHIGGDILGQFRALQERDRLELFTSAATHAYLPLLGRDESIRLQLAVGRAEHVRLFGREPQGCWLPECAYRPSGYWEPLPGASNARQRRGIAAQVADAGFQYVCVDAHMAGAGPPLGVYESLFGGHDGQGVASAVVPTSARPTHAAYRVCEPGERSGVAAFVRDPVSSQRVWSRHEGYPGDEAYLEFHKIRWPEGLRLWRVTDRGGDLGAKAPYDPAAALTRARLHGHDFTRRLTEAAVAAVGEMTGGVIAAPFDTELFGHWWFEGPEFLSEVYAALPGHAAVRPVTASGHLAARGTPDQVSLSAGSWGRDGNDSMWMNDQVAWMWPLVWELENRFWDVVPRATGRDDLTPVLHQAARELMLLQASDWPFIVSTGHAADYAIARFSEHARECRELLGILHRGLRGEGVERGVAQAHAVRARDDLFPSIGPAIAQSVSQTAV